MPFVYSNNGLSMRSVVEADYSPAEGEVVSPDFMNEEQLAAAFPGYDAGRQRLDTIQQINDLEAQQTARRLREAALTEEGRQWLENLDQQIAALRQSL